MQHAIMIMAHKNMEQLCHLVEKQIVKIMKSLSIIVLMMVFLIIHFSFHIYMTSIMVLLIHIENLRTWIPKTERYLQQQNWITLIISGIGLHIFVFGE